MPSSRSLVRRMLSKVDWQHVGHVVELGAGTGRITREILPRMHKAANLTVFERDPVMQTWLSEQFPGLAIQPDACQLLPSLTEQGTAAVDAIISGLPFALFSAQKQAEILDQAHAVLRPGGVFVAFQYSPALLRKLRRRFRRVELDVVPWNVPPALVYTCHK